MQDEQMRPDLTYPRNWEYRIVRASRGLVREAILEVTSGSEDSLTFSRFSKKGKYISFVLEIRVTDEAHRNAIYEDLMSRDCIKVVL